jgi:hypothetical protein
MRAVAKPSVNFFTRVSLDTHERRRRLQQRTGLSAPRLVEEALRILEANLDIDRDHAATRLATAPDVDAASKESCQHAARS